MGTAIAVAITAAMIRPMMICLPPMPLLDFVLTFEAGGALTQVPSKVALEPLVASVNT
jgi:hypothetical protein